MITKWNFDEDDFKNAVDGIKKQDTEGDFLGNLLIGHLSFDLKWITKIIQV